MIGRYVYHDQLAGMCNCVKTSHLLHLPCTQNSHFVCYIRIFALTFSICLYRIQWRSYYVILSFNNGMVCDAIHSVRGMIWMSFVVKINHWGFCVHSGLCYDNKGKLWQISHQKIWPYLQKVFYTHIQLLTYSLDV